MKHIKTLRELKAAFKGNLVYNDVLLLRAVCAIYIARQNDEEFFNGLFLNDFVNSNMPDTFYDTKKNALVLSQEINKKICAYEILIEDVFNMLKNFDKDGALA